MIFEMCYWSTFYLRTLHTLTVCVYVCACKSVCVYMCVCLISVVIELVTARFNILMKRVNMDGLIFVLSFANKDSNNDSNYH